MGNCVACMPEGRRRRDKFRSHKSVVPLNYEEEELSRTAYASNCTTTTERAASVACSKPKRSVRFAGEPVDGGGADRGEKGAGVRVRVMMTKKEAAQLLSTLLAEDNERSLKSISTAAGKLQGGGGCSKLGSKPSGPVFKQAPGYDSFWRPELETIPENC